MKNKKDCCFLLLMLVFIIAPFIRMLLNAGIYPNIEANSKRGYRNVGVSLKLSNKAKPDYLVILTPNSGYAQNTGAPVSEWEDSDDFPAGLEEIDERIDSHSLDYKSQSNIHWTRERWREERLYDEGMSYRTAGILSGFYFGAMAGMILGKGFQEKALKKREEYPASEWSGDPGGSEDYFTYDYQHAPYYGAMACGVVGSVIGYVAGVKEDKKYYSTVPREIRVLRVLDKSRRAETCCLGGMLWGTVMGMISGSTLYSPSVAESGKASFGYPEAVLGLVVGGTLGGYSHRGFRERALKKDLATQNTKERPWYDFTIIPLDQLPYCVRLKETPDRQALYNYHVELIRIDF